MSVKAEKTNKYEAQSRFRIPVLVNHPWYPVYKLVVQCGVCTYNKGLLDLLDMLDILPTTTAMACNVENLSSELVYQIFSYLDSPAPSLPALLFQPSLELITTTSLTTQLKTISRVSWRWRQIVLRILFKHSYILLQWNEGSRWPSEVVAFLEYLQRNGIAPGVESFTIAFTTTEEDRGRLPSEQLPSNSMDGLFKLIFETINPSRLTIVAPPQILALLSSCSVQELVIQHYHMPYHILSLTQNRSYDAPYTPKPEPKTSLFSIRPWFSILLNEGSFMRAWDIYKWPFTDTITPSILPYLVGTGRANQFVLPSTVREFSYIARFPFSAHLQHLEILLPRLQRLFIQINSRKGMAPDTFHLARPSSYLSRLETWAHMVRVRELFYMTLTRWTSKLEGAKVQHYLPSTEPDGLCVCYEIVTCSVQEMLPFKKELETSIWHNHGPKRQNELAVLQNSGAHSH